MLTLERAKEINADMVQEESLVIHSKNVMAAMGAMAEHFGEEKEHWMAVGYLHDYDYEKYPDEHLQHTEQPLLDAGVDEEDVRAIMSHGYGICTDVEPVYSGKLSFIYYLKFTITIDFSCIRSIFSLFFKYINVELEILTSILYNSVEKNICSFLDV